MRPPRKKYAGLSFAQSESSFFCVHASIQSPPPPMLRFRFYHPIPLPLCPPSIFVPCSRDPDPTSDDNHQMLPLFPNTVVHVFSSLSVHARTTPSKKIRHPASTNAIIRFRVFCETKFVLPSWTLPGRWQAIYVRANDPPRGGFM